MCTAVLDCLANCVITQSAERLLIQFLWHNAEYAPCNRYCPEQHDIDTTRHAKHDACNILHARQLTTWPDIAGSITGTAAQAKRVRFTDPSELGLGKKAVHVDYTSWTTQEAQQSSTATHIKSRSKSTIAKTGISQRKKQSSASDSAEVFIASDAHGNDKGFQVAHQQPVAARTRAATNNTSTTQRKEYPTTRALETAEQCNGANAQDFKKGIQTAQMQSIAAGRSRAANKSTSTAYQKEYPTNALEQADQYCVTYAQDNKTGHQVANRQPSAAGRSKAAVAKKSVTNMKEPIAPAPEQEAQCSEAPHNSIQSRQTASEQPVAGRTRAATACNDRLNSKKVTAPAGDQAGAAAEGHVHDNRRRQGGLQQQKPNATQTRTAGVASTALRSKRKQAAEIALDVEEVRPVAKRVRGAKTRQQSVVHDTDMPDAAAV